MENSLNKLALLAFDLDNTLSPPTGPIPIKMAKLLIKLNTRYHIAIITARKTNQVITKVLKPIHHALLKTSLQKQKYPKLVFIATNTGASIAQTNLHKIAQRNNTIKKPPTPRSNLFKRVYISPIYPEELTFIKNTLLKTAYKLNLIPKTTYGNLFIHDQAGITFTLLGIKAPDHLKQSFDKTKQKRKLLVNKVKHILKDYQLYIAGTTSIDIVKKGNSKGKALTKITKLLKISKSQVCFWGDSLNKGGNDYSVIKAGFNTHKVNRWQDTYVKLESIVKTLSNGKNAV